MTQGESKAPHPGGSDGGTASITTAAIDVTLPTIGETPPTSTQTPTQTPTPTPTPTHRKNQSSLSMMDTLEETEEVEADQGEGGAATPRMADRVSGNGQAQQRVQRRHERLRQHSQGFVGVGGGGGDSDVVMMGPILRRKKVVSMPLGADPRRAEFFNAAPYHLDSMAPLMESGGGVATDPTLATATATATTATKTTTTAAAAAAAAAAARAQHQPRSMRQVTPPAPSSRQRQPSGGGGFVTNILRRKQVSLDLLSPQAADFFRMPEDDDARFGLTGGPVVPEPLASVIVSATNAAATVAPSAPEAPEDSVAVGKSRPFDLASGAAVVAPPLGEDLQRFTVPEDEELAGAAMAAPAAAVDDEEMEKGDGAAATKKKLFRPLVFSPPVASRGGGGGAGHGGAHGHGGGGYAPSPETTTTATTSYHPNTAACRIQLQENEAAAAALRSRLDDLLNKVDANGPTTSGDKSDLREARARLLEACGRLESGQATLGDKILGCNAGTTDVKKIKEETDGLSDEDEEETLDENGQAVVKKEKTTGTTIVAESSALDSFNDDDIDGDVVSNDPFQSDIVRATRKDWIRTGVLFCLMTALTGVIAGWKTHISEEHAIFGVVGEACVTPCYGDVATKDFFMGNYKFGYGEVLQMSAYLDAAPPASLSSGGDEGHGSKDSEGTHNAENSSTSAAVTEGEEEKGEHDTKGEDVIEHNRLIRRLSVEGANAGHDDENYVPSELIVEIRGVKSNITKWTGTCGPSEWHERIQCVYRVSTDEWPDPNEEHVINAYSSSDVEVSFTLSIEALDKIAEHSVLIAALIMIFVYVFILLEWIHRTLVAVFGSLLALFFLFLMTGGMVEPLHAVMLHMEWSTLGLLFGMMLIVGELSHTGVFEWCSVRLLVLSKGSFNRLIALLMLLTAVSSAFLDNVTTMLLVAPVTIDMCNILGVDPRPYLIGEVLLSNVGGTATLIGDPPNIIIGSSFSEIGFVDFIINVLPCIFLFAIPATVGLVMWIYRYYLTSEKMRELDHEKLKRTYPIYDEPRLMIAGTVTFFVILMFFMHPLHHKDTAWIALLGAFITMAFTNPHDVQDALRNHIEWDTLLFFAGLFVLVEVCAAMGLLQTIGNALASLIAAQPEETQLGVAITLILWVSAVTSAFLDNIPYTATMIPIVQILADEIDSLDIKTLAWALSFGACLGGNGTLLGASANIVTAGISTNKGFGISFLNFLYPGMLTMILTVAMANLYMMVVFVWI